MITETEYRGMHQSFLAGQITQSEWAEFCSRYAVQLHEERYGKPTPTPILLTEG